MKILVVSYLYPNSIFPNHGIFVHNRIKALSKYVEVQVVNPIPWSPIHGLSSHHRRYRYIPEQEVIDGIKVYHPRFLSIPKFGKQLEVMTYRNAVKSVLASHRIEFFDIVDLHWTFPDLPAGIAIAEEHKAKLLVTIRGREALHEGENSFSRKCVERALGQVDGIIGVSRDLTERAEKFSSSKCLVTTIRNGVDTHVFGYDEQAACRQKLTLDSGQFIIFSVGSLIHRKGFDLTIKALASLRQRFANRDICLYIGGSPGHEGDYSQKLRQLIKQFQLEGVVHFIGQVANSELRDWYNAADVFCLSSRGEGSPNVLTEALACGCPSVTTNVGAANEILSSEPDQGFCVEVDSVQEIERGITQILTMNFDRKKNAARFSKYTWDWCAQEVVSFYEQNMR